MSEQYFINLSNHPVSSWGAEQRAAAEAYGVIIEVPFPNIPPEWTTEMVNTLAEEYCSKLSTYPNATVMCQGEFCFSYTIASKLKMLGYRVVAACSNRVVEEETNGEENIKKVIFRFVQFREY